MVRHLREKRGDEYVNQLLDEELKPTEDELRADKSDYFVDQLLQDINE